MYKFNLSLYASISKLLGITQKEFSQMVFGSDKKYSLTLQPRYCIRVKDIIKVCNTFHLSMADFITTSNATAVTNNINVYRINAEIFAEISFRYQGYRDLVGPGKRYTTLWQLSEICGRNKSCCAMWADPKRGNINMDDFLQLLNGTKSDLRLFINDTNKPLDPFDGALEVELDLLTKSIPTPDTPKDERTLVDMAELYVKLHQQMQRELGEAQCRITEKDKQIETMQRELNAMRMSMQGMESRYNSQAPCVYEIDETGEEPRYFSRVRPWKFNMVLLNSLPLMLDQAIGTMLREVGVNNVTSSFRQQGGNIRISTLINLCNTHRIPARFFFQRGDYEERLHALEYYQLHPDIYKPVTFEFRRLADLCGPDALTDKAVETATGAAGITRTVLKNWYSNEESSIRVEQLCALCDALELSPFVFINDTNKVAGHSATQAEYFLEKGIEARQRVVELADMVKRMKRSLDRRKDIGDIV